MLFQSNPLARKPFVQKHPQLKALIAEDLLDLQMSVMEEPEAHEHVLKCHSYLHLKGQNLSHLLSSMISLNDFDGLFKEATDKKRNGDKYITCLQVYLASEGENPVMFPVYQPVYLKRTHYDPITQKYMYTIPTDGLGKFYVHDKQNFVPIPESEKNRLVRNYQEDMTMIHTINGANYTAFDPNHDVESCLIPFQLMYKLMDETPSQELFVTNAIREIEADEASPIKHIVIVSGEKVDEIPVNPAKYANRSHLCPPCANIFGFDLA